jgi:hypothetical protein
MRKHRGDMRRNRFAPTGWERVLTLAMKMTMKARGQREEEAPF